MTMFLELKEKLKAFYAGYGTYILPAAKFLLALAVFLSINHTLNEVSVLSNVFIVLILSLICAILPLNGMVFLAMVVILVQCSGVHVIAAAFGAMLFLALWILYLRFASGEALALILTPLAFALHIPAAVPIAFGLAGGPVSALSVACGLVVYYFMCTVRDRLSVLAAADDVQIKELIIALAEGVFQNKALLVGIICCTVTLLVVYLIRSLEADYAWQISVIAGAIAYLVIQAAGVLFLEVSVSIPVLLLGTLGSCVICFVLEMFLFGGDYSIGKTFRFQDDEYYYYVKAVPKMAVSNPERKIRMISSDPETEPVPEGDPEVEEILKKYDVARKETVTAQEQKELPEWKEEPENQESAEWPENPEFPPEMKNGEERSGADGSMEKIKDDFFDSVDFEEKLTDTLKNL